MGFNEKCIPSGEPLGRISPPSPLIDEKQEFFGNKIIFGDHASIAENQKFTKRLLKTITCLRSPTNQVSNLSKLRFTPNYTTNSIFIR